jgi:hypothetical protein
MALSAVKKEKKNNRRYWNKVSTVEKITKKFLEFLFFIFTVLMPNLFLKNR